MRNSAIFSIPFILLFIAMSGLTTAQDYKPFIEPNKYWDVYRDTGEGICRGTTDRFFFISDTLINDFVYYQLAYYPTAYDPDHPPYCEPLGFGISEVRMPVYYREDAIMQEVYRLNPNNYDSEVLWLEFNKQVGDSVVMAYCGYDNFLGLPILGQEIVPALYGFIRRKFMCEFESQANFELIEGIGYTESHPFYGYCPLGVGGYIKCVYYGDNPVDWNCNGFISASPNLVYSSIKIFPNPIIDQLNIDYDQAFNIKIYSMTGELLFSRSDYSEATVNMSDFSSGIYIVKFWDKQGQPLAVKKILRL